MTSQVYEKPVCRLAGDTGFLVEFGDGIDPAVNAKVRTMARALETDPQPGIREVIPTYRSLLFIYDPEITDPDRLFQVVQHLNATRAPEDAAPFKVVEIPVCYGGDFGPDIANVRKNAGLTEDQVIQIHTAPEYLIYMVGFTPGFAFLGGLDDRLFTPRLETPRMHVPKGSVGIANNQTGMYPIASPGGWQLIGRTPLNLFAPRRKNPFLYRAGDKIRFVPISPSQYHRLAEKEKI
ncbi:MAG: 5-oxoprolinase subunit PxpB [Desulfotignum sp.]